MTEGKPEDAGKPEDMEGKPEDAPRERKEKIDASSPHDVEMTEEEKVQDSLRWQQALSQSLAAVAECIHVIPPGLECMDLSLTKSLETVAEECRNTIPQASATMNSDVPNCNNYSRADIVEVRLTELEAKFHLLVAYAKANAHAIARAYNRSCLRLSDLLCPLLDKNEMVPQDFPNTIGHFQQLPGEAVFNLLVIYQVPDIPKSDDERRIDLARYIGVNI